MIASWGRGSAESPYMAILEVREEIFDYVKFILRAERL